MMDLILTRLRHADGIPLHELSLLGYRINISALQQYMEHDMLEYNSSNRLKLGSKGWSVVDSLILKVIEATDKIYERPIATCCVTTNIWPFLLLESYFLFSVVRNPLLIWKQHLPPIHLHHQILMVLEKLQKLSSMSHWNEIQNFVAKTKSLKFKIYANAIHKDLTCLLQRVKQQKNLLLHYVLKVTFNVGRNMHIPVHLLSKSLPFALK